jgi:hypothetical protein
MVQEFREFKNSKRYEAKERIGAENAEGRREEKRSLQRAQRKNEETERKRQDAG